MPIVRFDREHLPSTAWKNGGGHTREIVRRPPDSGMDTFDWRASIADISADGPFSTFAGIDRVIVLLAGDGVRLRSNDGSVDHLLDEPLVPFAFAGDPPLDASLVGGMSSDFNVMTRRTAAQAEIRIVRTKEVFAESVGGILFAARGTWDVRGIGATSPDRGELPVYSLRANSGVWWDAESQIWDVAPQEANGALIAVRVTRRSG